jgi:hypothetical protein
VFYLLNSLLKTRNKPYTTTLWASSKMKITRTTYQMEDKKKLIKFLLFIFIQIITSTVVIILFQQIFHLKPIIIISHLFVICCIHLLIIVLGLLLYSKKLINYQKTTKYIHSSLYGIFIIFLYYTYLFAFLGQSLNSRIFTYQIVLGYLKHFNVLINTFSVSPLLVLFFIVYNSVNVIYFIHTDDKTYKSRNSYFKKVDFKA